jgi:16S rRNA (guanine966-N2)-methyltransferase
MRVVAGEARGRRLVAPAGTLTRPTADRVREAMFSMLDALDVLEGATVADLFAGSGALGVEALSRGAAHATFVERDARAVAAIRTNLAATGFTDRGSIVRAEAVRWLETAPHFDVVFADPPYAWDGWQGLLARHPGRVVVLESDAPPPLPDGFEVVRQKRYGTTVVTIAT